jgi:hypothetical protein
MASRLNNRPVRWQRSSPYNNPLLFVIPSEAEGSAVPRTFRENVSPERSGEIRVFYFDARLGRSLAGFFPKIDLAFLRVPINVP